MLRVGRFLALRGSWYNRREALTLTRSGLADLAGAAGASAAKEDAADRARRAAEREVTNSFISGMFNGLAHKSQNPMILHNICRHALKKGTGQFQ
jgi:hypothetical protein